MQVGSMIMNRNAVDDASERRLSLLKRGLNAQQQAQSRLDPIVQRQVDAQAPVQYQQALDAARGVVQKNQDNAVLQANAATQGGDAQGKVSNDYTRAVAAAAAENARRAAARALDMSRIGGQDIYQTNFSTDLMRSNDAMRPIINSANNQSQITGNAAQLVQPEYSPLAGIMDAVGGAMTSAGLGNIWAGGTDAGTGILSSAMKPVASGIFAKLPLTTVKPSLNLMSLK
jgi:hypothetical protein